MLRDWSHGECLAGGTDYHQVRPASSPRVSPDLQQSCVAVMRRAPEYWLASLGYVRAARGFGFPCTAARSRPRMIETVIPPRDSGLSLGLMLRHETPLTLQER